MTAGRGDLDLGRSGAVTARIGAVVTAPGAVVMEPGAVVGEPGVAVARAGGPSAGHPAVRREFSAVWRSPGTARRGHHDGSGHRA
ncbi:hypothetical protein [Streptomyces sp. NPDC001089]